MANLKQQMINSIKNGFSEDGMDKHSLKHNGSNPDKVFSYAERSNLLDIGIQAANFIRNEFGIKMIKDVKGEHIQKFLDSKASTCGQETLNNYVNRLTKVQTLVEYRFKVDLDWKGNIEVPKSQVAFNGRDIQMDREDLQKVLDRAKEMKSTSKALIAIDLAEKFGLRVSETVKLQVRDVDFDKMKLKIIDSKGKHSRSIDISKEDVQYFKKLLDRKGFKDKIVGIKEDSVNKYLARAFQDLQITKYKDHKTGVHSIRKMAAQELYNKVRNDGLPREEAALKVCKWLGHNSLRWDIIRVYVKNAW